MVPEINTSTDVLSNANKLRAELIGIAAITKLAFGTQ